ncbi:MAG: VCBS repeat-containing protein [Bacteroidetes bacterium]|nr:VCBS repeat-containing protein [Bacteroidota bacterium]
MVWAFTNQANLTCRTLANQPTRAEAMTIVDLDMDGHKDIVWGSNDYQRLGLFKGNGTGAFTVPANTTIGAPGIPMCIANGDFNEDGYPDLAIANDQGTGEVRFGNGTATIQGGLTINFPALTAQPRGVAVGDFNNDGHQDLAFSHVGQSGGRVSVFLGNGAGQFTAMPLVVTGGDSYRVRVGDFNGDGNQDFVTSNFIDWSISIGLGNGQGGFSSIRTLFTGQNTRHSVIGDFNGDGKQDIGVTVQTYNAVVIFLGGANDINVLGNATSIADGSTYALHHQSHGLRCCTHQFLLGTHLHHPKYRKH